MSLRNTDVRTPGAAEIAKKWNLPLRKIYGLISQGAKVEFEHNRDKEKAKQVARDHINERPDYYKKLKNMERLPIRMKEGLSTEPERDTTPIGDYTGASRKVMKVDEVKIPPKVKKAVAVGMTAANIATGAQVYDHASRGVGSPIKDVAAVATGVPGKIGWSITPGHYALKGLQKAKEHIKSKQQSKKMEEQGSPANPARYTERPMYEESKRVRFISKQNPADLPPRPADYKPGDFGSKLAREGGIKYPGKKKPSKPIKIDELSAELVGKVPNARFWRKEAPSKTLTRAINKKFIESGKKKESDKPVKEEETKKDVRLMGNQKPDAYGYGAKGTTKTIHEETTMDTKDLINEALDDILENNLVSMKENLMSALQEKAMEKLEEKKKEIAANYFAQ